MGRVTDDRVTDIQDYLVGTKVNTIRMDASGKIVFYMTGGKKFVVGQSDCLDENGKHFNTDGLIEDTVS